VIKAPTLSEYIRDALFKRFGLAAVIAIAAVYLAYQGWTEWDRIRARPGVPELIALWNTQPIPRADPGRYGVVVADIEGDVGGEYSKLILTRLREFAGIEALALHRSIAVPDSDAQEEAAHLEAVKYLRQTGGTILIWGSLLRVGGEAQPQLRLSTDSPGPARAHQYSIERPLSVSTVFWQRLATNLYLQLYGEYTNLQARDSKGKLAADELPTFIRRTSSLLSAADPKFGWDGEILAKTQIILGDALRLQGAQGNDRGSIELALLQYRLAAIAYSKAHDADWARLQNKRGGAQMDLADVSGEAADLDAAISTYRNTLALGEGDPAEREVWLTRASLGMALIRKSENERDPRVAQEAITEFRAALKEPRPWYSGVTDRGYMLSGLGRALTIVGEDAAPSTRLREAIEVLVQAANDLPVERAPRMYATTQNHLGTALFELGNRESDRDLLRRAVEAYENAMKYPDRSPLAELDRAYDMLNLGAAYSALGRLEQRPELIRQAVSVETEALQELKRLGAPRQVAIAENNIGLAMRELGRLEHNPSLIKAR